ncbi:MAG: hypothetical protein HC826_00950 [Rhodospirillales bacterium]|nr:hypothetical protein [Rhodospirillales bacterium]
MIPSSATTAITEFAPAKINLYLHVLGRRADGYHLLDSLVVFAGGAAGDVISVEPGERFSLDVEGPFASEVPTDGSNLVLRAAVALAAAVRRPDGTAAQAEGLSWQRASI